MSRVRRGRVTQFSTALVALLVLTAVAAVALPTVGSMLPSALDSPGGIRPNTPDTLSTLVPPEGFVTRLPHVNISGVMGAETSLAVADLTIPPGEYMLRVSFMASARSAYNSVTLDCGIVINNSGSRKFLAHDQNPIATGRAPDRHRITAIFGLPDVTLGVRCYPSAEGLISTRFDDVVLAAVPR